MQINQRMIRDFFCTATKDLAVEIADDYMCQAFAQIEDPSEAFAEAEVHARKFVHALAEEARWTISVGFAMCRGSATLSNVDKRRIDEFVVSHRIPLYCDLSTYIGSEADRFGLAYACGR